jgi:Tfp pilus assembly protein PilN
MTSALVIQRFLVVWSNLYAMVRKWSAATGRILTVSFLDGILLPRKNLAVSIEKGCVWVGLGSRWFSRIRIEKMRRYAYEEGKYANPESLASTLSLAIKELKAKNVSITLSLPKDWVVLRRAEYPVSVKETVADVIGFELDRLTPFSAEEAYYDFRILEETHEKVMLLVLAVRMNIVTGYVDALKAENIGVGRLTVNLSGIATVCSYVSAADDFIFIDAGTFGYQGGKVHGGRLTESFSASLQDGIEGTLSVLAAEAEAQGNSLPIFFHSRGDGDMPNSLGESLPLKLLRDRDLPWQLTSDREGGVSLAILGSLIEDLEPGRKGLDLFCKGVVKTERPPIGGTGLLLALLLATLIPFAVLPVQREEKRLAEINRQISSRKEEVRRVEALRKEVESLEDVVESIEGFKEGKPEALVILKELTTVLPRSAWLTRVRITDKSIDIEGYASSASEILPKLEQSKYFKKVEFGSPTVRDGRTNSDRFVIKMELEGFGEEDAEKPGEAAGKTGPTGSKPVTAGQKSVGEAKVKNGKK